MKKIARFSALMSLIWTVTSYANIPNTNYHPTTFLGPSARMSFNGFITDTSAYSFGAEGGIHNGRLNGTVGWNIINVHYIKLSAEYLWQDVRFPFFDGTQYKWVNQGALGGMYKLDFDPCSVWHPTFNLNAYLASASAVRMNTKFGTYSAAGVPTFYTLQRAIVGSKSSGFSPGFSLQPWHGGTVGIDANYDNVRYENKILPAEQVQGWGGTAYINQTFYQQFSVGALAGVRKPFNFYQADVGWQTIPCNGSWLFKLFGAYVAGKDQLPNTYNVGLSADYFLDMPRAINYDENVRAAFFNWMAKPAVAMPQVLARSEEIVSLSP
jgi:hypothetical protein